MDWIRCRNAPLFFHQGGRKMKNPNGFGTVYKMSGKRRKKWRAVKTINWEEGKQKRITIGYYESKQEAMEELGKYIYNPNAKLKLKDVYEMWSKIHYEKVSENTKINLHLKYKIYISKIGEMLISEITLKDLQEFIDGIKASSSTLALVKIVLNGTFEYAVKNDFIQKNPVKYIELGKVKRVFEKKEFTLEEIDILWNNLQFEFTDTVLILIYTGMRVKEMLTLKIEDINLEKRTISILEGKTKSSTRIIPIHPKIFPLITRKMHNQEYLVSRDNKPIDYNTYIYAFKKLLKSLKIQRHTPHECRHTTATLLSNAGANPVSIAKIMGHTDYNKITAKVYTHKNETELEKAINTLN